MPLAVSFSRGAWIATAVAVGVVLLLAGLRLAVRTMAVLAAVAVVLVGGAGVGSQMMSERFASITEVSDAPDRSGDRPVRAVGGGGLHLERRPGDRRRPQGLRRPPRLATPPSACPPAATPAGAGAGFQREPLLSPHNMYLLVLSEQGLVGITALLGSWAALLVCALRRLPAARRGGRHADCGLIAIGLLVWQAVDFLYADIGGPTTVLTAVLFGLVSWWALATPEPARGADTR